MLRVSWMLRMHGRGGRWSRVIAVMLHLLVQAPILLTHSVQLPTEAFHLHAGVVKLVLSIVSGFGVRFEMFDMVRCYRKISYYFKASQRLRLKDVVAMGTHLLTGFPIYSVWRRGCSEFDSSAARTSASSLSSSFAPPTCDWL